jgi:hypothetical protein
MLFSIKIRYIFLKTGQKGDHAEKNQPKMPKKRKQNCNPAFLKMHREGCRNFAK